MIAIVGGAVLARFWGRLAPLTNRRLVGVLGFVRAPLGRGMAPQLAGRRLTVAGEPQVAARLAVWFVSGIGLALGMGLTAMALAGLRPAHWPAWWIGGLAFIGIELVAHTALQFRGHPSFYNGRG
jgi:hypothetical protein